MCKQCKTANGMGLWGLQQYDESGENNLNISLK